MKNTLLIWCDQFRKLAEQLAYEDAKVMVEYFKDKIDSIFADGTLFNINSLFI